MISECRFDNGMTLLTEEMPDLRSVTIGVWLRRGSRHELPELNGISHFIEHLVFKGTERRTALEIAREIDAVGGQMDAFTGKESTCFYVRVLDRHLDLALDLLSDIVLHPWFRTPDIEKERKVIFEEIRMVEDSPEELLSDMLFEERWPDHPLGRPIQGTFESVVQLERDVLKRFFQESYIPPDLVLAAAGRLDAREVEAGVRRAFEARPVLPAASNGTAPVDHPGVKVRNKTEMEQLHLCLGLQSLPQAHPDRHALRVLSNLLGGTMSSRLFQKIREDRGLAYSVYSAVSSYSDAGFQSIYAATSPKSAVEVLKIIGDELNALKAGPVGEVELQESKENLKGSVMLNLESSYSRMSSLARKEIVFGRQFTPEEILAGIDAVTAEDLQRLACQTFRRESANLVALGRMAGVDLRLENVFP
ncbi:MAG: M16 family metallopeptidase [Acidobacteriota bacterium]